MKWMFNKVILAEEYDFDDNFSITYGYSNGYSKILLKSPDL